MDGKYNREEFWTDFARRWEERIARRAERWQARQERRAARYAAWGSGAGSAGRGYGYQRQNHELEAKVEAMTKTIEQLTERITTLEKLAVDPDARLAAEIERLRREDNRQGETP
ncbi:MAG: hypothetical protein GC155_02715 [Alphaproteobacteria bacterium]|nr:hypothetical protein [Alphaproteobacteria bacterium]